MFCLSILIWINILKYLKSLCLFSLILIQLFPKMNIFGHQLNLLISCFSISLSFLSIKCFLDWYYKNISFLSSNMLKSLNDNTTLNNLYIFVFFLNLFHLLRNLVCCVVGLFQFFITNWDLNLILIARPLNFKFKVSDFTFYFKHLRKHIQ